MTAVILWKWNEWNAELIITAAIAALIPIHVVEEWVFPGGFHYQYNYCMGSDQLDRYPMCRKSDMFTNLIATFMYIDFTVYAVCNDGIGLLASSWEPSVSALWKLLFTLILA